MVRGNLRITVRMVTAVCIGRQIDTVTDGLIVSRDITRGDSFGRPDRQRGRGLYLLGRKVTEDKSHRYLG